MNSPFLTIRDVADLLRLSPKSIYRLAQKRELPCFKVGGSWRFRRKDLDEWVADMIRPRKRA